MQFPKDFAILILQKIMTMKVYFLKGSSHVTNLLEKTGLQYFDLLLYYGPFHHFKNEDALLRSWPLMCSIDSLIVKHAGLSNFYSLHLERILLICAGHDLPPPFANEIQMSPFVFDEDLLFFCKEVDMKIIAYSPVGFDFSNIWLGNSILLQIANSLHVSAAEVALFGFFKNEFM